MMDACVTNRLVVIIFPIVEWPCFYLRKDAGAKMSRVKFASHSLLHPVASDKAIVRYARYVRLYGLVEVPNMQGKYEA
jgi:hypothetical protein